MFMVVIKVNCCDFGTILKQLRNSKNLTQSELGQHIGLSKAVVSKYENGLGYPTFDVLIHFAKFFNVSTDYLLGIEHSRTIDASDLTEGQINTLFAIIDEYRKLENN